MTRTMDEKLQEQIDAPAKRKAEEEAKAKAVLDELLDWLDNRIEEQERADRTQVKIIAGSVGGIFFIGLAIYFLGIYIATSG